MSSELFDKGRMIRTQVLSAEYVNKAIDGADDFNRDFQQLLTEYCWGYNWSREGLTLKQRSLLNLGILAALNRGAEFEVHFRGAIKNGLTMDELQDALIQIAIYCGMPAGVEAFRIANKVRKELASP